MTKKSKIFGDVTAAVQKQKADSDGKQEVAYLKDRDSTLSDIASGKYESRSLLWVAPEECRIWEHHNRRYDLLSEARCQDLIDGFKSIGHQEFPAIVRPLTNDPDGYTYEVIAGARRHWTVSWLRQNNYKKFKFLIDVRADLSDEEAFRISDIENRDREDISDYERALDYQRALGMYYRNQKDMAERIEMSEGHLSHYMALADLPKELVSAYADIRDIRIRHARDLKVFLKSKAGRQALARTASKIEEEQAERQKRGERPIDGSGVVQRLKASGTGKKRSDRTVKLAPLKKNGKIVLSATYSGKTGLVVKVPAAHGASRLELMDAFEKVLEEAGK